MMLLQLENIRKYFPIRKGFFQQVRDYVRAVDHVDLNINEGENLGLVGESGSGKTTLGRIIVKLYEADQGKLLHEGEDISQLTGGKIKALRRTVQMVFQDPYSSLDPRFTIRSILKEALVLEGRMRKSEYEQRMEQSLKDVGLPIECLRRFPHEFSGGERQRIAIARSILMNPKLLILDEAVSSLDVLIQVQIIQLLKELQNRYSVTYLFISHNLRVIKKICQRIAVMYKGKIVELASTDELFANPLHPYTKELLTAAMDYRSVRRTTAIELNAKSRLSDQGNGHFVIN